MKKKYLKISSIILGIVFLLLIVANFGLNFWLKNNLPNYIKNNSNYLVTYKTLDVDLGTGNIFSTGITINNKNPQNHTVIGFQGTIDTLSIARVGLYDAIFKKEITTSDLKLSNPNLNIILPDQKAKKVGKKKNPISLDQVTINSGNIQIFKCTKQKVFSIKNLNLKVKDLQMNDESAAQDLPFVFDDYRINGKNLFFRSGNVYAFTAKNITTKEQAISINDFAMIPLLSYKNYRRFYPEKGNLFDFKSSEMNFKGVTVKNHHIKLEKVRFENPDLKIFTTNVKPSNKQKNFPYDVNLEDVLIRDAKISITKPNGYSLFSAGNLTVNINKVLMNEETTKGKIPFQYSNFKIDGQKINYVSNTENIKISILSASPKQADFVNISMKPTVSASDKALQDITAKNINLKINELNFSDNRLKLNIQNILINELNGKIIAGKTSKKKKPSFDGILFPLTVKNVSLKNSNLTYDKGNQPLVFKDLNANIQNIELNESTIKQKIPFKTGFYSLTTRDFKYHTKFYNMSASLLKINKNLMQISNFALLPTVSRAQFIRMIPTEKDLYDIRINQITMNGNWDFLAANKFLEASQVTISGANANIFRSKIPKDDLTEKPLYSKLLRSVKFPMLIKNLDLKNSVLVYEEDTKKSDGPGKLVFNNFNLNAKNINSAKMKRNPTFIPIEIKCLFMNASPMNVKWSFDTANLNDAFSISGNVADLPAARINPFIEPYLKIRATGVISDLIFNFKGTNKGIGGRLKMTHQNLKISILKTDGEKNKILSAVANVFVKSNSGNYPESVTIEHVNRDKTRSFFNLFWHGIEQGLKKTLIGINAPKTEEAIKETINTTKSAIKEGKADLKKAKIDVKKNVNVVKENVKVTKEKVQEKKIFKNLFKKKSASR